MMIEAVCGTGMRGFAGDNMPAFNAVLDLPVGIALSPSGELYIADQANQRIRRVNAMDVIATVVGNGTSGFSGDNGPAAAAQINNPTGQSAVPAGRIVFDSIGNLFIADTGNHRIRRVDPNGTITTVAGTGNPGTMNETGPATLAELNNPSDVEIGPDGTLYIADTLNSCVRAVGSDGMIRTVVGRCGQRGSSGDGGPVAEALLNWPFGLDTDKQGNLWIADTFNHEVRIACIGTAGTYCKTP
jgi:sugar lactone lactonase YvrE